MAPSCLVHLLCAFHVRTSTHHTHIVAHTPARENVSGCLWARFHKYFFITIYLCEYVRFHKYYYGLGAHYNSTQALPDDEEDM